MNCKNKLKLYQLVYIVLKKIIKNYFIKKNLQRSKRTTKLSAKFGLNNILLHLKYRKIQYVKNHVKLIEEKSFRT